MEIKVRAKEMLQPLAQVAKVVNSKNALPILADVLIDIRGGFAFLTTSDSEMWLSVKCPIISADEDARFCIGAQDLLKALGNLGDVNVTITVDKDRHTATFNYGNGKFMLPYEDATEYPQSVKIDEESNDTTALNISGERILKAIEKVGFATANDELRPVMNGIHFDMFEDGMVCASSDGHKLARYKDLSVKTAKKNDVAPNFTLPKKPANIIMLLLNAFSGDLRLCFDSRSVVVRSDSFKLTARLIEGRYPNYNGVIPQNNDINVTIDKTSLINAIRRVIPMSNASSNLLVLKFSQKSLTIKADDFDFSKSASETLTCDYDGAEELTIGFKGATLFDMLRNIDDDNIIMELKDQSRAGLIYSVGTPKEEYLSLIMPMLLNS